MAKTVVGLFHDTEQARMAVQDLVNMGIPRSDISLMSRQEGEAQGLTTGTMPVEGDRLDTTRTTTDESAAAGAGVGAVVGGVGGLLVGMGLLVIPGIGPILAAGPLVAALTGAALGAGVGALVGALVGMGVPEEEAQYYAEGVRRGATLVAVNAPENQVAQVTDVLRQHDPVDIKRQAMAWRESGWTGYDPNAAPYTDDEVRRARSSFAPPREHVEQDVPMRERETERVGEHTTSRPVSSMQSNTPRSDTPTHSTAGTKPPQATGMTPPHGTATETHHGTGTTTHYGTESTTQHNVGAMHDTPPRTGVGGMRESVRPWTDYETSFRRDFERRWKGTSATWDKYEPAYHYAYDTANDPRYRDRDWNDAEFELRRDWEDRHQDSLWDDVKDAVREAWDRVRGQ